MPNIPTYVEDLEALDRTAQMLGQLLEESSGLKHTIDTSPSDETILERLQSWNITVDETIGACDMRDIRIALSEALSPIDSADIIAGFHARRQVAKEARDILREEKTRIGMAMDDHEKSTRSTTYGEYEVKPTGEVLLNGTELVRLTKQTKKLLIAFLDNRNRILSIPDIKRLLWSDEDRPREGDNKLVVSAINKLRTALRIEENRTDKIKPVPNTEAYKLATIYPDTPD